MFNRYNLRHGVHWYRYHKWRVHGTKQITRSSKSFIDRNPFLTLASFLIIYGRDDDMRDGKQKTASCCPGVWICYSSCFYLSMEHLRHCSKHGFTALSRWMWNSRKTFLWKEPGGKLLLFKLISLCELSGWIQKFWSKVQYEHQYPAIARWACILLLQVATKKGEKKPTLSSA